jgi:hypothetical protein
MYSTPYSCKIVWNWNFFYRFSENTEISNFTNIFEVEAELLHAAGRTDVHDEANSRFSPKKGELRTEMEDVT